MKRYIFLLLLGLYSFACEKEAFTPDATPPNPIIFDGEQAEIAKRRTGVYCGVNFPFPAQDVIGSFDCEESNLFKIGTEEGDANYYYYVIEFDGFCNTVAVVTPFIRFAISHHCSTEWYVTRYAVYAGKGRARYVESNRLRIFCCN